MQAPTITWEEFEKVEIHIGTVLTAGPFPEAKIPAIKLTVDFGSLGIKQSSAQITIRYSPEQLVGRQVAAVTNFPPKKIAGFKSEVLVLGAVPGEGDVVLLNIDAPVPDGTRVA